MSTLRSPLSRHANTTCPPGPASNGSEECTAVSAALLSALFGHSEDIETELAAPTRAPACPRVTCPGCRGGPLAARVTAFVENHCEWLSPDAIWRLAQEAADNEWRGEDIRSHYEGHALNVRLVATQTCRELRAIRTLLVARLTHVDDATGEREAHPPTQALLLRVAQAEAKQHALLRSLPPPPPYSYHDQASPREQSRAGRGVAPSAAQPSSTSEQPRSEQAGVRPAPPTIHMDSAAAQEGLRSVLADLVEPCTPADKAASGVLQPTLAEVVGGTGRSDVEARRRSEAVSGFQAARRRQRCFCVREGAGGACHFLLRELKAALLDCAPNVHAAFTRGDELARGVQRALGLPDAPLQKRWPYPRDAIFGWRWHGEATPPCKPTASPAHERTSSPPRSPAMPPPCARKRPRDASEASLLLEE